MWYYSNPQRCNRLTERDGDKAISEKAMFSRNQKQHKKDFTCNYCRKSGHVKRNCFKFKNDKVKEENRKPVEARQANEEQCSAVCFKASIGSKKVWCVDSGSSSHVTNDRGFFRKFDDSVRVKVWLANGASTTSVGIGEGILECYDDGGNLNNIPVKEVLYVPDLDGGLLSVRKLTQKGLKVVFHETQCNIIVENSIK